MARSANAERYRFRYVNATTGTPRTRPSLQLPPDARVERLREGEIDADVLRREPHAVEGEQAVGAHGDAVTGDEATVGLEDQLHVLADAIVSGV